MTSRFVRTGIVLRPGQAPALFDYNPAEYQAFKRDMETVLGVDTGFEVITCHGLASSMVPDEPGVAFAFFAQTLPPAGEAINVEATAMLMAYPLSPMAIRGPVLLTRIHLVEDLYFDTVPRKPSEVSEAHHLRDFFRSLTLSSAWVSSSPRPVFVAPPG